MVENSVQNDADAVLCTFPDKFSEQLICAKRRIDLKIVACIIAMIGIGAKNRVQVQHRDTQRGKVFEFFDDTFQITAEKIVIKHLSVFVCAKFRRFVPICMQPFPLLKYDFPALVKPIGKDLIHHTALKPIGRCIIFRIDR